MSKTAAKRPALVGELIEADHPVSNIEWVDVNALVSNDYNPNFVQDPEMKLLAFSLLQQGWIQPILVCPAESGQYTIIDGFHRHRVVKTDKHVWALTGGKVPVCILDISEPERMLLTIRINRAKGSHAAIRMHDIVRSLVEDHAYGHKQIAESIGASREELEALMMEDVFEAKEVDRYEHSKAWLPPGCINSGGV